MVMKKEKRRENLCALEDRDDGIGEFGGGRLATEITSNGLTLTDGSEDCILNSGGMGVEAQVTEHHDGAQQEGCGVCLVLSYFIVLIYLPRKNENDRNIARASEYLQLKG